VLFLQYSKTHSAYIIFPASEDLIASASLLALFYRLYVFDGYAESAKLGKQPLDINNLLLRGSMLRKTEWVIGLALNVGKDSKIVKNMTKAPRKVSVTDAGGATW
jgi:magnesium-transporting ATPase (P-type)